MIKSFATTLGALILISGTLASQQFNARTAATDLKNETVDCLPNSDEYYRRIDALVCDEDYVEDVSDAIEKSTCINYYYTEEFQHYYTKECVPLIDNRTNVDNCSDECSLRQKYYYYCTYLWEKELDRVDVVVMRQLLLYCCNSTREPLLELKFPVCIASSNTYQVAYSIFHEFVLMVNISQMLNNPFRWYYGTVVYRYYETALFIHVITLTFHEKTHIELFFHSLCLYMVSCTSCGNHHTINICYKNRINQKIWACYSCIFIFRFRDTTSL